MSINTFMHGVLRDGSAARVVGMTEAEAIADKIANNISDVKSGTLRFWGEWFGRPYDNVHRAVACDAQGDLLRLIFNENEILSVWSPRRAEISSSIFRIRDAARVRWEWFYYGRPQVAANRYFEDFVKTLRGVEVTTNVDWHIPNYNPTLNHPAVEIL